jgi:hypothetical protein
VVEVIEETNCGVVSALKTYEGQFRFDIVRNPPEKAELLGGSQGDEGPCQSGCHEADSDSWQKGMAL